MENAEEFNRTTDLYFFCSYLIANLLADIKTNYNGKYKH